MYTWKQTHSFYENYYTRNVVCGFELLLVKSYSIGLVDTMWDLVFYTQYDFDFMNHYCRFVKLVIFFIVCFLMRCYALLRFYLHYVLDMWYRRVLSLYYRFDYTCLRYLEIVCLIFWVDSSYRLPIHQIFIVLKVNLDSGTETRPSDAPWPSCGHKVFDLWSYYIWVMAINRWPT